MRYVLLVEFDPRTPELAPSSASVADVVRTAMDAEFSELGYRTTTAFEHHGAAEVREDARRRAGIHDDSIDPPWGEQQSQVDWLESRFDEGMQPEVEPFEERWEDDRC